MPDFTTITELKNILEDNFGTGLSIHNSQNGQYFSLKNLTPSGKEYIINYFREKHYQVTFNEDYSEFTIKDIRLC